MRIVAGGSAVGWGSTVIEYRLPSGALEAPPHVHGRCIHTIIVTVGRIRVMLDDHIIVAEQGGCVVCPPGVMQALWNDGPNVASYVKLAVPGGHEECLEALADCRDDQGVTDDEALPLIGGFFDVTYHPELVPNLTARYGCRLSP